MTQLYSSYILLGGAGEDKNVGFGGCAQAVAAMVILATKLAIAQKHFFYRAVIFSLQLNHHYSSERYPRRCYSTMGITVLKGEFLNKDNNSLLIH